MTEHRIKVYGERNTGTRAALTMLRAVPNVLIGGGPALSEEMRMQNAAMREAIDQQFTGPWRSIYTDAVLDMECLARGHIGAWKHSLPVFDESFIGAETSVLLMVRDPYSWALSLFRKPYHSKGPRADTLLAFLDQPWLTERRDYLPPVIPSPMVLWNEKLRATLQFCVDAKAAGVPTHLLRFEDFIADPVAAITAALNDFSIPVQNVQPVQNSTKNEAQQLPALQRYYREELWRKSISKEAARRIDALTDWSTAARLGYQPRSLSEFPRLAKSSDPQGEAQGPRIQTQQTGFIQDLLKRLKSIPARRLLQIKN